MSKLNIPRIRKLIERQPMQYIDFADAIGISKAALYKIFDTASTRLETVDKIARVLKVDPATLYEGASFVEEESAIYKRSKPNVTYVPMPVQAGFLGGFADTKADLLKFYLPTVGAGDYFLFDVVGDSMQPTICNGDQVICEKVNSVNDIRPREAHVIFQKRDGVVVKRLSVKGDLITLSSDNEFYPPYEVKSREVQAIYRIRKVISSDLTPKQYKRA